MRVDNNEYVKNQCSLVVRVDGNEMEVPVTFGMSAEEIRMVYPFLVSILNDKIENPIMQFNRSKERGEFADLSEEEYNAQLHRVVAQSKYWYEKPETGLLDVAIRFALDIKLRGIADLESVFTPTGAYRPFKLRPVTEEEAGIIMHRLQLDDTKPAEDMPEADNVPVTDDLSDVEAEDTFAGDTVTQARYAAASGNIVPGAPIYDEDGNRKYDIPNTMDNNTDAELMMDAAKDEQQPVVDEIEDSSPKSIDELLSEAFGSNNTAPVISEESSFAETMRRDLENIDASRYQSEYKPEALSEDEIKDGLLVRDMSADKPVSVIDAMEQTSSYEEQYDADDDEFDTHDAEPNDVPDEDDDSIFDDSDIFDDDDDIPEASFVNDDE